MAADEEKSDFYSVLGLDKNCSSLELRNAYKKLALKWHPDRSSATGDLKVAEESKKNFQAIQEAYSVLSDEGKRFMYDVGIYNADDDDENDMGDFLGELATMMSQTKPSDNGEQSFEDLQNLFQEMFQKDDEFYNSAPQSSSSSNVSSSNIFSCSYGEDFNKNNCPGTSSEQTKVDFHMESLDFSSFPMGVESDSLNVRGRGGTFKRTGKKHKVSSRRDMSSHDAKVLA